MRSLLILTVMPPPAVLSAARGSGIETVKVTGRDIAINPEQRPIGHGRIKFEVRCHGPSEHEFVILEMNLARDRATVGARQ